MITKTHYDSTPIRLIDEIQCDKCGKLINSNDTFEYQEMYHLRLRPAYNSVFGDGATVECDLCQQCLKELIGKFCRVDGKKLEVRT